MKGIEKDIKEAVIYYIKDRDIRLTAFKLHQRIMDLIYKRDCEIKEKISELKIYKPMNTSRELVIKVGYNNILIDEVLKIFSSTGELE